MGVGVSIEGTLIWFFLPSGGGTYSKEGANSSIYYGIIIFYDFLTGVYTSFTDHCKIEAADSHLPDLVDYDEYDAKVFRNPSAAGHFVLKGFPPRGSGFRRIRSAMEIQRMAKSFSKDDITSHKFISPKGISSYEDLVVSASSSSSTMLTVSSKWAFERLGRRKL